MTLRDRTAVVTGAARGIGLAVCRRLAAQGCRITLWDLDEDEVVRRAAELREGGAAVYAHAVDVSDADAVYQMARVAREEMDVVDILVNNAGVLYAGNLLDRDDDCWRTTIDVNLTSLVYTIRAFLPAMLERDRGHIVNVSSAAATVGVGGLAVYAATKWGVWGLTESMRHETLNAGKRGVRWSSIHPNYIAEGMFAGSRIPGLGGLIIPILRNHDVVARAVVEGALKRGRRAPKRPRSVKLASFLRGILPDGVFGALTRGLSVARSMEGWRGRTAGGETR